MKSGQNNFMVQRMFRMLKKLDENVFVTVATSESQIASIMAQLGNLSEFLWNFLTKHLIIKPGQYISYKRHKHCSEIGTL